MKDRADWLKRRKAGLGGSDAAAILGLSKFRGPLEVWLDKTSPDDLGGAPNEIMQRGIDLEPIGIARYERETGHTVADPWEIYPSLPLVSDKYAWHRATPDGVVLIGKFGERRLVEIKTSRNDDAWGDPGTDEIPAYYLIQNVWTMSLVNADVADTVLLGPFLDQTRIYTQARNLELEAEILDRAGAWWNRHIIEGERPEATTADAAALARLIPQRIRPELIEAPELAETVRRLAIIKDELKMFQLEREKLEMHIKNAIGDAAGVKGAWGKATFKQDPERMQFKATKAIKAGAIPQDIIDQFSEPAAKVRRFLFTPAKSKGK